MVAPGDLIPGWIRQQKPQQETTTMKIKYEKKGPPDKSGAEELPRCSLSWRSRSCWRWRPVESPEPPAPCGRLDGQTLTVGQAATVTACFEAIGEMARRRGSTSLTHTAASANPGLGWRRPRSPGRHRHGHGAWSPGIATVTVTASAIHGGRLQGARRGLGGEAASGRAGSLEKGRSQGDRTDPGAPVPGRPTSSTRTRGPPLPERPWRDGSMAVRWAAAAFLEQPLRTSALATCGSGSRY